MLKNNEEEKKFNKIIRLIRKDSHKGIECFYAEYGKIIYIAAKSAGCSEDRVYDVIDVVLTKIWQKANKISNVKNPRGWIFRMARNCAIDELNERWHLELKEEICKADDELEKVDGKDEFEYLISPLKENERDIFIFKFRMDYTFQDIANILEIPLPTITTTYYRALAKIQKFIKKENYE